MVARLASHSGGEHPERPRDQGARGLVSQSKFVMSIVRAFCSGTGSTATRHQKPAAAAAHTAEAKFATVSSIEHLPHPCETRTGILLTEPQRGALLMVLSQRDARDC